MALLICLIAAGCRPAPAPSPATVTAYAAAPAFTATPSFIPSPTIAFTRTPAIPPTGSEIVFEEASRNLTGTLYGEGKTAILLANMSIGGQAQWSPFLAAVDPEKFTTVTFDYRSSNGAEQDTRIVLERLREKGYARIICIGASLGVTACSRLAGEPEIVGMVLIAGRMIRGSLAELTYPKLFIAGALDPITPDIGRGYEQSAEPKELVLFEANRAHGTDLFSSKDGDHVLAVLIDFVNSLADP